MFNVSFLSIFSFPSTCCLEEEELLKTSGGWIHLYIHTRPSSWGSTKIKYSHLSFLQSFTFWTSLEADFQECILCTDLHTKLSMNIVCQTVYSVYSTMFTEICCTVSELSQLGLNVNWNNFFFSWKCIS
jgi:mevalonate kinase